MSHFHFLNTVQPAAVTALDLPPNIACQLVKKRTVVIRETPMPVLQPDGVLVKVMATGICGSDMHGYLAGGVAGRPTVEPITMAHESSGEVIAVGELVTTHKVGDRVAIEPGLPCRRCLNCKLGRSNICLDIRYCGAPGSIGSLSRFYALPADMAPRIPDNVSWLESGSIQPLAIGVQIAKRVDLRAHHTVAVFGCGPIGLISAAVAHAYSASRIIGFDINPKRVAFARKYISPISGKPIFDHVFETSDLPTTPSGRSKGSNAQAGKISEAPTAAGLADADTLDHEDDEHIPTGDIKWEHAKDRVARWLQEAGVPDEGVDRVIEATGSEDCSLYGCAIAKQGGIFLAVGLAHVTTRAMPMVAVTNKELDIRGITRYTADCFPLAMDLLRRGQVDLKQLITKTFPLAESHAALEAVAAGNDIKIIILNQE